MYGYFDFFPDKTNTELRTLNFPDDPDSSDSMPSGTYAFTEYYCTDLGCDCQRVLVKVLHFKSERDRPEEVATISYSWNESPDASWSFLLGDDTPNPFLDPFHHQGKYATELIEFWDDMVQHDEAYAERLK